MKQGGVIPPELPGLGVELDTQALAHYHRMYLVHSEMDYFAER